MRTETLTADSAVNWAESIVRDEWTRARAEYTAWRHENGLPVYECGDDHHARMALHWHGEVE